MRAQSFRATASAIALVITGCGFGSATTEGDIAGYGFNIRTVYGWIEETVYDGATRKYQPSENKRLYLMLSGATFDPNTDQRFISYEDQLIRAQEEMLNGRIRIRIDNFEKMTSGGTVTVSTAPGGPADGEPSLWLDFDLAAKEIAPDAKYPEAPPFVGTRITYSVKLDSVDGAPGDEISGILTMTFAKSDFDSDQAWLGTMTVKFTAELISEMIAGCIGGAMSNSSSNCDVFEPDVRPFP